MSKTEFHQEKQQYAIIDREKPQQVCEWVDERLNVKHFGLPEKHLAI